MSGQPNRYSTSAATYRQQYMDALGMRASLNDQVLQAVKVYKQTGQLPAVSSLPDTRTSSEKLADVQGLKVKLVAELKQIIDPQGAQAVVQGIERSPLNGDGSLFSFFAQRIKAIVKILADTYGVGIKGDSNDIETFIKMVEDYYSKTKDSMQTAKSYFDSYQTRGGITVDQLDSINEEYVKLMPKLLAKFGGRSLGGQYHERIQGLAQYLLLIKEKITNANQLALSTEILDQNTEEVNGNTVPNLDRLHTTMILFKEFQEQLPSLAAVRAVINQIYKALPNRNSELVGKLVDNLISLFPSIDDVDRLDIAGDAAYNAFGGPRPAPRRSSSSTSTRSASSSTPSDSSSEYDNEQVAPAPLEYGSNMDEQTREFLRGDRMATSGGEGIKRRRGRPRGCGIKVPFSEKVDMSQGVQASPRYISFGKHVINKKKLGDGILSIRTKSGANIASSPVKHISQNMKIVVDKIIGGAIPSYEELSRLTEEEKAYLHKVSKQADILDKFSIPAPSKDQEEKEIHEYEVMRGEIMSGNDNKELIKKFKLLIIKLSRRGALPKKEVSDILSELIELGY